MRKQMLQWVVLIMAAIVFFFDVSFYLETMEALKADVSFSESDVDFKDVMENQLNFARIVFVFCTLIIVSGIFSLMGKKD